MGAKRSFYPRTKVSKKMQRGAEMENRLSGAAGRVRPGGKLKSMPFAVYGHGPFFNRLDAFIFVMSAPTRAGAAIAMAILSAAIVWSGPAAAADAKKSQFTTAEIMRQFIYSPWIKVCGNGQRFPVGTCVTSKFARDKNDKTGVIAVSLIEVAGKPRGLSVGLPETVFDRAGKRSIRIMIDEGPAIGIIMQLAPDMECSGCARNTVTCNKFGVCSARYQATAGLVDELKNGRMLQIQAVSLPGFPTIPFSLADNGGNSFAGANGGAPTDLNGFVQMLEHLGFCSQADNERPCLQSAIP
jgi:invasion protein IalB